MCVCVFDFWISDASLLVPSLDIEMLPGATVFATRVFLGSYGGCVWPSILDYSKTYPSVRVNDQSPVWFYVELCIL